MIKDVPTKVEVKIEDLKIEGYNSDYEYIVEGVNTERHFEVHPYGSIVFFLDNIGQLEDVESDVETIIIETTLAIEALEEEQQEEISTLDKIGQAHEYYMQNTI